jgi:acyl-CoA thioesterase
MTMIMPRHEAPSTGTRGNAMTDFTELMDGLTRGRDGDGWQITVGDDWLQGRTVYGGLAAALCAQATLQEFGDLPPLRSAQIAFIGPATGQLQLSPSLLRKGKSTVFAAVDLIGAAGLATRAMFCFGAGRSSALAHTEIGTPRAKKPEECSDFFRNAPPGLRFLEHIDGRHVAGSPPFSGSTDPSMMLWLRHRTATVKPSLVSLLALADAPPPAATVMARTHAPISTMTWALDMLTDNIATDDGWWLLRNVAEQISDGYSSQAMTVWNATGQPIMASRQNIAVFG